MDFFESLFKRGAGLLKKKAAAAEDARAADFEDYYPTLSLLATAAAGHPLELRAVDDSGFLRGHTLALPRRIARYSAPELNAFCLFHQALYGGALHALGAAPGTNPAAEALALLEREFPAFGEWRRASLAAIPAEPAPDPNALVPDFLAVKVLPPGERQARAFEARKRERNQDQSEREAKNPGEVEAVDLDKERKDNNPVMHSFEKMETADEYRGGHRITDAGDDLEDHAAALDELNLNKVTRSGDRAQSVYRAEVSELFQSEETELAPARDEDFLWFPEWDYQRRELKPRHCRLYFRPPMASEKSSRWLEKLREEYSAELLRWEQQWLGLVNQRVWRDRQWEGEDLDIDGYVRYLADVRSAGTGDARVFLKRQPGERNMATLILLDQSYSTDSFVDGRRVLDVELESIGLSGLLLDKLREPVAVAGTWSETRSHCTFQWHKKLNDPWSTFFASAPEVEPMGYTRLGPAIRHATKVLWKTGARSKLLILLTDGKPTDYDRYEGRYGIEDIRHSFLEARQSGVEVKALAIEKDAKHYFPALFGARNYQILSAPRQLPEALFRLYLEARKT